MHASKSSSALSLKEYLKKYENGNCEDKESKDKRKKKKKKQQQQREPRSDANGIRVIDEDPAWQKPVILQDEDEDNDSSEEEKPQVDEDIEVKRMKRLEEIRLRRPYLTISGDGSGWVSISDTSKRLDPGDEIPSDSPPRKRRVRFDSPWPEPESKRSSDERPEADLNSSDALDLDRDFSPPRRSKINDSEMRHNSPDSSATRGQRTKNAGMRDSPDFSPPRLRRSNTKISGRCDSPDLSPTQLLPSKDSERHESLDLSPPRRLKTKALGRHESPDLYLPQKSKRHDSERHDSPAFSPPRRVNTKNSYERISPDISPRRSKSNNIVSCNLSPSRQLNDKHLVLESPEENDSRDISPPRRRRVGGQQYEISNSTSVSGLDLSPPRKNRKDPPLKTGWKNGLVSKEFTKEIEKGKKEAISRLPKIERPSEMTYRVQGIRVSKDEYLKMHKAEENPKEKKLEWGTGLAQKKEAEARQVELELEKDKPFARSRDDPELEKLLKERVRWGDPMAHLVSRKQPDLILEDLGGDEKMKESGFLIPQAIPTHSWLKRGIDPPANRYGIKPGRHWDGVDRSNGYEKEMFKRQNEKAATEREAYLWSVSEM